MSQLDQNDVLVWLSYKNVPVDVHPEQPIPLREFLEKVASQTDLGSPGGQDALVADRILANLDKYPGMADLAVRDYQPNTASGFAGMALENMQTGDRVVLCRGTEGLTNLKDVATDGIGFTLGFNAQYSDADEFYRRNTQNLPANASVFLAGHSLGGAIVIDLLRRHPDDPSSGFVLNSAIFGDSAKMELPGLLGDGRLKAKVAPGDIVSAATGFVVASGGLFEWDLNDFNTLQHNPDAWGDAVAWGRDRIDLDTQALRAWAQQMNFATERASLASRSLGRLGTTIARDAVAVAQQRAEAAAEGGVGGLVRLPGEILQVVGSLDRVLSVGLGVVNLGLMWCFDADAQLEQIRAVGAYLNQAAEIWERCEERIVAQAKTIQAG